MKIDFPYVGYEGIEAVEIPDDNLMGVYAPQKAKNINEEEVLSNGFENPIASESLSDLLKGKKQVLVLIDDGTRGTPIDRILDHFSRELESAHVPNHAVSILTAQGTHREMTDEELRKKLGRHYGRFRIHQHRWLDESQLHFYGHLSDGTKVTANKLLPQSDFIIGFGSIVPHRVKGFSGGAKIAFPGVAGREMMERNQWDASIRMSETVMGIAENPMRLRMEEAARMVGLNHIVNLVSDADGKITGCFVGDVVEAHRAGCEMSREINGVILPKRADIVITDAYPADRDFWQSAKGYYSGTMAVRRGGTLICAAPNPEGVANNHPNVMELGYQPHETIIKMVHSGRVKDIVGAAILGDMAQIVDWADCIMVSPGVKPHEAKHLGLRYAATVQEALAMAFKRQGKEAFVAVLRHGGHLLPIVESESKPYFAYREIGNDQFTNES